MGIQDDWTRITLRVPPELFQRFKEASSEINRSTNAQIVELLKDWLAVSGTSNECSEVREDAAGYSGFDGEEYLLRAYRQMSAKQQRAMIDLFCSPGGNASIDVDNHLSNKIHAKRKSKGKHGQETLG